ncbi:hypothetical protein B4088_3510 [Bacillus cereus]|uniref:Uncharacterized protein n=1 Tax=Bacillus cereus TaxID=1396 RepID=A0A164N8L5_BACCE|nr:hypothetical protein B4088_3510 [Bacillus cereus]
MDEEKVLQELEFIGVSETIIYGDNDYIASYLKNKYTV